MTINVYKFSYEINGGNLSQNVNYVDKTLNHIRLNGGIPNFSLPIFYRCKATFTRLNANDKIGRYKPKFKIYYLDPFQVRRYSSSSFFIDGHILKLINIIKKIQI